MSHARPKHNTLLASARPPLSPLMARGLIAVAIGSLALLALLLLSRWSAMVRPLPTPALLMVSGSLAICVVGVVSLWNAAWPSMARDHDRRWQLAILSLTGGLLLLIGIVLTTSALSQTALAALWLPILIAVAILAQSAWRVYQPGNAFPDRPTGFLRLDRARSAPPASTSVTPAADEQTTQQLSRGRGLDGSDWLQGRLLVAFVPGQRTATMHVAFCPPFALLPRLQATAESTSGAKVKVAQVLAHGARFELKLATAASRPTTEWLTFTATTATVSEAASLPGK